MRNFPIYLMTVTGSVILQLAQPITFGEPHPYSQFFAGIWEIAQEIPPLTWIMLLSIFATYMGTQHSSSLNHWQKFFLCFALGAVFAMVKQVRPEAEMEGCVGFIKTIMVFMICFFAATKRSPS